MSGRGRAALLPVVSHTLPSRSAASVSLGHARGIDSHYSPAQERTLSLHNEAQHKGRVIILSGEWKMLLSYQRVHTRRSFPLNADFIAGEGTGRSLSARTAASRRFTRLLTRATLLPDVRSLRSLPRARLPRSLLPCCIHLHNPQTMIKLFLLPMANRTLGKEQ